MTSVDWEGSIDLSVRIRRIEATFVLTHAQINAALKAGSIYVDGVYYEVPIGQLRQADEGENHLMLTEKT